MYCKYVGKYYTEIRSIICTNNMTLILTITPCRLLLLSLAPDLIFSGPRTGVGGCEGEGLEGESLFPQVFVPDEHSEHGVQPVGDSAEGGVPV